MFSNFNVFIGSVYTALLSLSVIACNTHSASTEKKDDIVQYRENENADLVSRGRYLVTVAGCNDCHSPKKLTPQGPVVDSVQLLSGHPADMPLPPFDRHALVPGNWIQMGPDLTAYAGPWGISYAANLTPDTATGIGSWTEQEFVKTIHKGKHLGMENGRPILPPMPWEEISRLKDEDLRAVYQYLRSLPPIHNQVPAPLSPADAARLARKTN